ncbi:MAG: Gfo/Idh/MocA family oxidoreductase [Bacillati bacterium ANGP1]|uniref:Gfo/Idh/MocA family oxidoreductase n=1 Tax=Candidatus Segetimicrobium genomatis TaxID=2569760 RepID=A0A537J9G2_9BACT|nr:MAG: Gfo/Idh/MocA family oxidoreductase [Terrabacteria group bacterium ANGP1]
MRRFAPSSTPSPMMRARAAGRPAPGQGPRDDQETALPLRVALIGCGLIGRRRADVIRRTADGTLVVAADVDLARAEAVAEDTGCQATADWEAVVDRDDVQAVIVATPHNALAAITTAALRCGKHVLVEKPMARTPPEADAVLKEATPAGGRARRGPGKRPLIVKVGFKESLPISAAGTVTAAVPAMRRSGVSTGRSPAEESSWTRGSTPSTCAGGSSETSSRGSATRRPTSGCLRDLEGPAGTILPRPLLSRTTRLDSCGRRRERSPPCT